MQKGFTPILIVVIVAIVGAIIGGAYYFGYDHGWEKSVSSQAFPPPSPSPNPSDETVNWKTYIDPKNIFSIQYPSNTNIEMQNIKDTSSLTRIDLDRTNTPEGGGNNFHIWIILKKNSDNLTNKTLKDKILNGNQSSLTHSSIKEYQNNNLNGWYFINDEFAGNYEALEEIQMVTPQYIINIGMHNEGYKTSEETRSLLNQILSTFKFTQ